ncbi:MAG TPA: SDR family oxidoreductase [Polyangiales bacterium]|nr:SDR family oxidoreductase [Polyangiales bacterium]
MSIIDGLRGKKCFITGAASGIGRATAVAAGARGAVLFLTDIDAQGLAAAVTEIRGAGGTVAAHRALDIADFEAVRSFANHIHELAGSIEIVMNIAGISVWGAVEDLEHRHWRKAVEVDLMGPIHVIESFVPAMIRAGKGGHIVNVSSAAGLFGLPLHAAYSAAKFGLRGISEVLRFDLEAHGIGVSLVCPGAVNTGLVKTVELVGIDQTAPGLQRMRAGFRRRAVSSEVAAAAILRGIDRKQYLVFTSHDVRLGHFVQTKLPFLYERVMRAQSRRLARASRSLGALRAAPSSDRA